MSISNVVGARIAGVAAVQSSGQPGSDNATLTMRGQSGIVYVIDGIRRTSADFNGLDPNEIESVSILKDASAVAAYGLMPTVFSSLLPNREKRKRCLSLIPVRSVSARMRNNKSGWTVPDMLTGIIKHGSYKVTLQYLPQKWCRKMKDGVDGWGNTNWYDKIYGTGTRTHHNISATGGSDRVRFFASIGYLDEKGNIDNYGYNRLNLRSNIDAKLTKSLTFTLEYPVVLRKEIPLVIPLIRMTGIMSHNKLFVPCLMCPILTNMMEKLTMYLRRPLPLR